MSHTPFTDPAQVAALYRDTDRTRRRTTAVRTAKISGEDVTARIIDLAAEHSPVTPAICEIGCGHGSVAVGLAQRLHARRFLSVDISAELLTLTRERVAASGHSVTSILADFHDLPPAVRDLDLIVAAFCLYHSSHPQAVIGEIATRLAPGGRALLVTKSIDSYHEIDELIAASGLDPAATERPSLYRTFHSGNALDLTTTAFVDVTVLHSEHRFRFPDFDHLAAYVATTPKYQLRQELSADPRQLAAELRSRISEHPLVATSTVTYTIATK
jgi:SAM-dependent methyltransferase